MEINRSVPFFLLLLLPVAAQAVEFKPKLEAEGRWFWQAEDAPLLGSVAGTLETFSGWGDGRQRVVGEFFARYDENDDVRTHGDVRELYYQQAGDDFEFRLGARRVFWGVTESRHLVDIINQSDFIENISGEMKLGQPMLNLALIREYGTVDAFLMPYQRARTLPGADSYPRLPYPVDTHEAQYESRREQAHVDYALRYAGSFGPLDFGLAWFDGTAREPRLEPCVRRNANGQYVKGSPDGPTCPPEAAVVLPQLPPFPTPQEVDAEVRANLVLVPFYDRLRQASLDAQIVFGSLALKVEALRRRQQHRTTWGAVTGFEYTFGDVRGSGADIGLLAEYLYDKKNNGLNVLIDDEVFAGSRLAVNDVAGTQLLAGMIASRDGWDSLRYSVEASRRLTDDWKLSLEARMFSHWTDTTTPFLADQDYLTVTLERFF